MGPSMNITANIITIQVTCNLRAQMSVRHYFKWNLSNVLSVSSFHWFSDLKGQAISHKHPVNPSRWERSLPCGHRDLGQGTQHDSLLQPNKGNEWSIQEVNLSDKHVGSLCIAWQFFHKFILQLHRKGQENTICFKREKSKKIYHVHSS